MKNAATITAPDISNLAAGLSFLGSGGGGGTRLGETLLRHLLKDGREVSLIAASDLPGDALVLPIAAVGSGVVIGERLPNGGEVRHAVESMERHLNRSVAALISCEVAGINGFVPLIAGAELGLPVIDADGMGRAFSRIEQTTFALHGISASPTVFVDALGNEVILSATDTTAVEAIARAMLPAMGGWMMTGIYPMTAAEATKYAIADTVSGAVNLGACLNEAAQRPHSERQHALDPFKGQVVFSGTVLEVRRPLGTETGAVTVAHQQDPIRTLRVEMGNEYMLLLDDGALVAQVPDVITLLDTRTWQPISTEHVIAGCEVDVVVLPTADIWYTPEAASLVGPAAFGLDLPAALR